VKHLTSNILILLSITILLSGCSDIGKRLAKKSFRELENKVAEQQETIAQLSAEIDRMTEQLASQLEEKPVSEPAVIQKKGRNISSMFSRGKQ